MKLRTTLRSDYNHFLRLCGREEGAALWRMCVNPRTLPVVLIRVVSKIEASPFSALANLLRLLILWWFRVEIPKAADIGPGLVLPHPGGIVIGSNSIGENVVIFQNVTLGARAFDGGFNREIRPTICDNVILGANAVVLGPVTVGDNAVVGANSLILRNIAPSESAVGVPVK